MKHIFFEARNITPWGFKMLPAESLGKTTKQHVLQNIETFLFDIQGLDVHL